MFESLLRVGSFYWSGETFRPSLRFDRTVGDVGTAAPEQLHGAFACAAVDPDGGVSLLRDRLGLNKLFVSVHETGTVLAASYLTDLVRRGVPLECIYSVPPGHIVHLDPHRDVVELDRYAGTAPTVVTEGASIDDRGLAIRAQLEVWFSRLAVQFGDRKICVCLSGGLDSGIIAAFAKRHFADVTAYTYAYMEPGTQPSDDAVNAERLAAALQIPLRFVRATADDLVAALDDALCYGQDWRDFNVHCAIVNEILARAIRDDAGADLSRAGTLVLTGDLANELLADYTPVSYDGRQFYTLPDIDMAALRSALVRGLDAGDREIGVFGHHGLDLIQPYGLVAEEYLRVPGSLLGRQGIKQAISRSIAGDLLPGFVFDRVKVRAQIGNPAEPTGILPVLLGRGCDGPGLRRAFCRLLGIREEGLLNGFIRAGRYRVINRVAGRKAPINGYLAA